MEDEIDLREMLQILWRGKFLVLAITAGAALLAVLYFFLLMPPVYPVSYTHLDVYKRQVSHHRYAGSLPC